VPLAIQAISGEQLEEQFRAFHRPDPPTGGRRVDRCRD
jgi:hypothetical protein